MSLHDTPKPTPASPRVSIAQRVAELRQVVVFAVSDDDMTAVVQKLIEVAKEGNLAAIRTLFAYVLGKPTGPVQTVPIDRSLVAGLLPTAAAASADPFLDTVAELFPPGSKAGEALGAALRQQLLELDRPATVTKRNNSATPAPMSATASQAGAKADTARRGNQP